MNYFVWQRTCVDESGNVLPSASVTVTDVMSGALATLYSDEGVTGTGNPIAADSNGFVQFFVKSGIYTIVAASGANTRTWAKEAIGSPYKRTSAEVSAEVTPTDFSYVGGEETFARRLGAVLDGTTDDSASLDKAISLVTTTGALTLVVDGVMALASDETIPAGLTIKFVGRGALKPGTGVTITYNGRVRAEPRHIFRGAGDVVFSASGNQRDFWHEWWGAVPDDSTDNYSAMNACQINASEAQGVIWHERGVYRWTGDLACQPNTIWQGKGKDFGTSLKPDGTATLQVSGAAVSGGYAYRNQFRDMVIDGRACNSQKMIVVDTAYNIKFRDVFLFEFATQSSSEQGLYATDVNDLVLDTVTAYGASNATPHWGIVLADGVKAKLISPDVEVCNRGVVVAGTAQVDIFSPYCERNVYGIWTNRAGAGALNIYGGHYDLPNSGSVGIGIEDNVTNVAIFKPDMVLNGGTGIDASGASTLTSVELYGVPASYVSDPNGVVNKVGLSTGATGGSGSAGAGNQYVQMTINGTTYKVLHDGTV